MMTNSSFFVAQVNILVHASDFPWSTDQINSMKTLMRMKTAKGAASTIPSASQTECDSPVICFSNPEKTMSDLSLVDHNQPSTLMRQSDGERPSGILWDVFRRKDAPKLLEYFQKHADEFYNPCGSSKQQVTSICRWVSHISIFRSFLSYNP